MVAFETSTAALSLIVIGLVALAVVAWLVVTRVFPGSRAARHADHFFDGDSDLSPQDEVKFTTRHPGAGGHG